MSQKPKNSRCDFSEYFQSKDRVVANEAKKLDVIQRKAFQGVESLSQRFSKANIDDESFLLLMAEIDVLIQEAIRFSRPLFEGFCITTTKSGKEVIGSISCLPSCSCCCSCGDVYATKFEVFGALREVERLPHEQKKYIIMKASAGLNPNECCFLRVDGLCGIYKSRPVACRTYFSLTPSAFCHDRMNNMPNREPVIELEATTFVGRAFVDYFMRGNRLNFIEKCREILTNKEQRDAWNRGVPST